MTQKTTSEEKMERYAVIMLFAKKIIKLPFALVAFPFAVLVAILLTDWKRVGEVDFSKRFLKHFLW